MDPSVKKIINNSAFIANLAPLIEGPEASALAAAARAYKNILHDLEISTDVVNFDGCEQAQKLVEWWIAGGIGDADLMNKWSAEIRAAVRELAAGKLPTG